MLLSLASCKKDDTLYRGNVTMGNIEDETIISDQGNRFDIVETPFEINFAEYEYGRVMLACDVLKQTSDKRYDIRVLGMSSVLTKEAVKSSTITDPESELAVEDAIIIKDIWYGGGYLNMLIQFAQQKGSTTKHFINLIYDDTKAADSENSSSYTFTLRHNEYGEVPSNNGTFVSSSGYVSFPIANIIKGDQAEIIMKWKSHRLTNIGEYDLYNTEERAERYPWKRSGYEHPETAAITSPAFRSIAR